MSAKGHGDPGEDQASREEADNYWGNMKRAIAKQLIERYFYQLTEGCGNPYCDNQNCASSGKVTNLTPNQAAAQAIQLFFQEARLCDGTQPSKVARTTLEPGPASLAKSLPVKSVNPTCSDEGIALNLNVNSNCLVINSVIPLQNSIIDEPNLNTLLDKIGDTVIPKNACKASSTINLQQTYSDALVQTESTNALQYQVCKTSSDVNTIEQEFDLMSVAKAISEENFLKVFQRYKIQIPNYKKQKVPCHSECQIRQTFMNQILSNKSHGIRKSSKKSSNLKRKFNVTYCSRSLTKLLVLALYLKHLESKRYSGYIINC